MFVVVESVKNQVATEHAQSVDSSRVAMEMVQEEKEKLQALVKDLSQSNTELTRYNIVQCTCVYTVVVVVQCTCVYTVVVVQLLVQNNARCTCKVNAFPKSGLSSKLVRNLC